MASNRKSATTISLFRNSQLHTLALGQTTAWSVFVLLVFRELDLPYPRLFLAYHEHICLSSSE